MGMTNHMGCSFPLGAQIQAQNPTENCTPEAPQPPPPPWVIAGVRMTSTSDLGMRSFTDESDSQGQGCRRKLSGSLIAQIKEGQVKVTAGLRWPIKVISQDEATRNVIHFPLLWLELQERNVVLWRHI